MKNDDQILQDAADQAEQHEIVGQVIADLNKCGLHAVSADVLLNHIMSRAQLTNPRTFSDIGKDL